MKHRYSTETQERFIIEYINKNGPIDVTNQDFHEQFYEAFGGKRTETMYGAQPVHKAQRLLEKMHKRKELSRGIVGLPERVSGFPSWVYVYSIWGY